MHSILSPKSGTLCTAPALCPWATHSRQLSHLAGSLPARTGLIRNRRTRLNLLDLASVRLTDNVNVSFLVKKST
jgi:hypothetical protein